MPKTSAEQPLLVVFFGLVASGKSHLARRWARRHHCPYYNTDVVRKKLFGLAAQTRQKEGVRQGIYSPAHTERTYLELLRLAAADVEQRGRAVVVLDGSYLAERERQRLVKGLGDRCMIVFIYCFCSEAETKRRLERRAVDPHAVSDGRWEIYLHQKEQFQVPDGIRGVRLLQMNTEGDTETLLSTVDEKIFGVVSSR